MEIGDEARHVHTAHRDYYLRLAEQARAAWQSADREEWLARLRADKENLGAALDWSREQPDGAEALARLTGALTDYWEFEGQFSEGRRRMDEALGRKEDLPAVSRVRLLVVASRLAMYLSDYKNAASLLDESMDLARREGDGFGIAETTSHRAYLAQTQARWPEAAGAHAEAFPLWEALGATEHMADALTGQGFAALIQGDVPGAIALFERSLALCRAGTPGHYLADTLLALGFARALAGQSETAMPLLAEGLTLSRQVGTPALTARGLEECAFLAGMRGERGEADRAARLLGAVETLRARIGVPMPPAYAHLYHQLRGVIAAALSPDALEAAFAAGRALSLDEAVALALTPPS